MKDIKRITIRVIPEHNLPVRKIIMKAGAGKRYTEDGLDRLLDKVADEVAELYPAWDFRMVEVAPNSYNFVFDSVRDIPLRLPGGVPFQSQSESPSQSAPRNRLVGCGSG